MERDGSPMAAIPVNKLGDARDATKRMISAEHSAVRESMSCSPLPEVELNESALGLIKENARMMCTIEALQSNVEKLEDRVHYLENDKQELTKEVRELRQLLHEARETASTAVGKAEKHQMECERLQLCLDKQAEDMEKVKEVLGTKTDAHLGGNVKIATARRDVINETAKAEVEHLLEASWPAHLLTRMRRLFLQCQEGASSAVCRPADVADKARKELGQIEAVVNRDVVRLADSASKSTTDAIQSTVAVVQRSTAAYLQFIFDILKTYVATLGPTPSNRT